MTVKKKIIRKPAAKVTLDKKPVVKKSVSQKDLKKVSAKLVSVKKVVVKKVASKKSPEKKAVVSPKKVAPLKAVPKKSVVRLVAKKPAVLVKKTEVVLQKKSKITQKKEVHKALPEVIKKKDSKILVIPKIKPKEKIQITNGLSSEELAFCQNELKKELESLVEKAEVTVNQLREMPRVSDDSDRATEEENWNFEFQTRRRERLLIRKIELAFQRIKDGVYGVCAKCEEPIGFGRLKARLVAEECINCKNYSEQLEITGNNNQEFI